MTDVLQTTEQTAAERPSPPTAAGSRWGSIPLATIVSTFSLAIMSVLLIALFGVISPDTFLRGDTFVAAAQQNAVLLILALAVLVPLAAGEFDLSIGANLGLAQMLVIGLQSRSGLSAGVAIVLVIAIGLGIGLANGLLVTAGKMHSFIATLATGTLLGGIVLWYSGGTVIFEGIPESFTDLGRNALLGVPLPLVYALLVAVALWILLEFLPVGRAMFAAGGNADAARLSGVPVTKLVLASFVLCGGLSALAGVVVAMRSGSASPDIGPAFLLSAYAAAFLGVTSVRVGRVNVWGTVLAMAFLAIGITGIEGLGVPSYGQPLFYGAALIVAVLVSGALARRRKLSIHATDDEAGGRPGEAAT